MWGSAGWRSRGQCNNLIAVSRREWEPLLSLRLQQRDSSSPQASCPAFSGGGEGLLSVLWEREKKSIERQNGERKRLKTYEKPHDICSHCARTKKPHLSLAQKQQINKIKSWDSDVFCSDKLDQIAELHVDLTDTRCYAWSDATMFISLCDTCQSLSFALKGLHLKGNKLKADSCAKIQVHSSLKVVRN